MKTSNPHRSNVWHFNKAFYLTSNRQYYGVVMQKNKIVYYDEREVRKKSIEKLSAEQQAFALFGLHDIYTFILLNLSIFSFNTYYRELFK